MNADATKGVWEPTDYAPWITYLDNEMAESLRGRMRRFVMGFEGLERACGADSV